VYGSTSMDVEQILKDAPLFSQLHKKDIKRLAAALTERSFPAGAVIIEQGKPGVGLFLIGGGTATASVSGKAIRTMKAGDHFGEVALIDDGPRSAEVKADTDVECFVLPAWQFRAIVSEHPDVAWALLRSLVQRVVRDAEVPDTL
jgi:CRP/FNR family transcriptional regulator, cyclic AMP receptor protein